MSNVFETLNSVNVNEKKEQKNQLDYLSWAWAWAEVKKRYPEAYSIVYEDQRGLNYFTDGRTCYVKVGMVIEGLEHIEYLPVMDYRNQSIPQDKVTSFDVNKAIQRALTKAIARHGLGLYIYAGEDLPEEAAIICESCGKTIKAYGRYSAQDIVAKSQSAYGEILCADCIKKKGKTTEAKPNGNGEENRSDPS